jgi:hypothetical protein
MNERRNMELGIWRSGVLGTFPHNNNGGYSFILSRTRVHHTLYTVCIARSHFRSAKGPAIVFAGASGTGIAASPQWGVCLCENEVILLMIIEWCV